MSLILPLSFYSNISFPETEISGNIVTIFTAPSSSPYPDSNFIFGGIFQIDSNTLSGFALIDSSETLDAYFRPKLSPSTANVKTFAVSSGNGNDFRFVIGGSFSNIDGVPSTSTLAVINLSSNGTTFSQPGFFTHLPNNTVESVFVTDRIYCGGRFTSYINLPRNRLVAYNLNGTYYSTFTCNADNTVFVIKPNTISSTTIYVGGAFRNLRGTAARGIARINKTTGELDTNFRPLNIFKITDTLLTVRDIEILPDGRVIVASTEISPREKCLIRLPATVLSSTTSYESFAPFMPNTVLIWALKLKLDNNNKLLAWVNVQDTTSPTLLLVNRLYRFNVTSDISLDTSFGANNSGYISFEQSTNVLPLICSISIDSSDKIILAGNFTRVDGINKNGFAKVSNNGTVL
jgi:hypothetical protein